MTYSFEYNEAGFIEMICQGEADLPEMKAGMEAVLDLAVETQCYRIFNDFRAMQLKLSLADIFCLPDHVRLLAQTRRVNFSRFRRALVVLPRDLDKYQFFETAAVNRAHTVKVFLDEDAALQWLLAE